MKLAPRPRVCSVLVAASVSAAILITTGSARAESVPPPSGLIGWWPGDGDALNRVGPPGSLMGGAGFAAGMVGQAFQFSGSSQYVATSLDVQPSAVPSMTWEAWVFPTTVNFGTRQQILSDDDGGYDRSLLIESGTSNFGVFTGSGVWQPTAVSPDEWQHVAVVFTPDNIVFYKNGVAFTLNQPPTGQASSRFLSIGSNPGFGEFFHGRIDEVSVYHRALSAEEIGAIFAAGADGKTKVAAGTADLSVTSILSPDVAALVTGDKLTNQVVVFNAGPNPAPFVSVTASIPPGLTAAPAQITQGTVQMTATAATAVIESLAASDSATLTMVLTPSAIGVVSTTATVASTATDPAAANNTATASATVADKITATDGDWSAETLTLLDTPEAELMVRVGDIDNLGFGWPAGFSPFTGQTTPQHVFPWVIDPNDPAGTDRIMVPSSYAGTPPRGQDGYTGSTSRPANLPQPILLNYDLGGHAVTSAAIQLFVDDFQAPNFGAAYQVTLNGVRCPVLEDLINPLVQTGPVGKLITTALPDEFLPAVQSGHLALLIDDPVTGAGDGYAIDFVKLLINVKGFSESGTLQGTVVDSDTQRPIPGATVRAQQSVQGVTDDQGHYVLGKVAAGLVSVTASEPDHHPVSKSVDLQSGQTVTLDFALTLQPLLRIEPVDADHVRLSWPAGLADWKLQASPNVTVPADWALEGSVPSLADDRFSVINLVSGTARFYRLAK